MSFENFYNLGQIPVKYSVKLPVTTSKQLKKATEQP